MHGEPELWARAARPAGRHQPRLPAGADRCRCVGRAAVRLVGRGAVASPTTSATCCRTAARCSSRWLDSVPRIHFGVGHRRVPRPDAGRRRRRRRGRLARRRSTRRRAGSASAPGAVQGNLDPALLLAPWPVLEAAVRAIVTAGRAAAGHIFNLGHGVLPDTDPGRASPASSSWSTRCDRGGHDALAVDRRRHLRSGRGLGVQPPARADVTVYEAAATAGGKLRRRDGGRAFRSTSGAEALLTRPPRGGCSSSTISGWPRTGSTPLHAPPPSVRAGGRLHPLPRAHHDGRSRRPGHAGRRRCSDAAARDRGRATNRRAGALAPLVDDVAVGALVRAPLRRPGRRPAGRPAARRRLRRPGRRARLRATMPGAGRPAGRRRVAAAAAAAVTDAGRGRQRPGRCSPPSPAAWAGWPRPSPTAGPFAVATGTTVRSVAGPRTASALDRGGGARGPGRGLRRRRRRHAGGQGGPPAARRRAGRGEPSWPRSRRPAWPSSPSPTAEVALPAGQRRAGRRRRARSTVKAVTLSSQKWPLAADGLTLLRASVGPHRRRPGAAAPTTRSWSRWCAATCAALFAV